MATNNINAVGMAFTRNPTNGDKNLYGELLLDVADGEDIVTTSRNKNPINEVSRINGNCEDTLEKIAPDLYFQLVKACRALEVTNKNMMDIEFSIVNGSLKITRAIVGHKMPKAAIRIAVELYKEKTITAEEAVSRITTQQLEKVLHPVLDQACETAAEKLCKGFPAAPGGVTGQIVFTAMDAIEYRKQGKAAILLRAETNPEDIEGMRSAVGILTASGGMTSHAALVTRGWGKCCIVGASDIKIDVTSKRASVNGFCLREGDWVSLNGSNGNVYNGQIAMTDASEDEYFQQFMTICDKVRKLAIRVNADTPEDAIKAKKYGATGVGLMRIEHMFY